MSRYEDALSEAQRAVELRDAGPRADGKFNYQLVYIEARAGRTDDALRMLAALARSRTAGDRQSYFRPLAHAALRDTEQAFAALEEMYQNRNPELLGIRSDPAWDLLRDDARFKDLLHRIGYVP